MDYFNKTDAHLQGEMDLDAVEVPGQGTKIISIGSDDLIIWRNQQLNQSDRLQLPNEHGFNKIALHPSGNKFLLGGQSKNVYQYSTNTKAPEKIVHQSPGQILDIKYSPSGRFISIATDEQKVLLYDSQTNRKTKCRPGHNNSRVLNTFFSSHDRYVASIGQDCYVLVYELVNNKDPQQVYRTKFTNQSLPFGIKGCFSQYKQGYRVFVPGTNSLQMIQQLTNRWQIKKTNIGHSSPILVCQAINSKLLVTSCKKDLVLWSIGKQQKLIVLQDFPMAKIIRLTNKFICSRNDGNIYTFNRDLSKFQSEEKSQIQAQGEQSQLNFDNQEINENIQLEYGNQQGEQEMEEDNYLHSKKNRADKIIKVFPQKPIFRQTSYSQDQRFIYISTYGYIIQTRQNDQTSIFVEFNESQGQARLLFKNRKFQFFAMNRNIVCYANQNHYGARIDSFSSWEKQWYDIQGIALGANWIAIANDSEIRILDLLGSLIKVICFDRIIVAMQAYQNLLAVVYHEGVPIYECQLLSMKIFNVSAFNTISLPDCHVPLQVSSQKKKQVRLRWFGFSKQGMIFSQDQMNNIRAYSLQSNQWTPVAIQPSLDPKKVWIVGFENYNMKFWKVIDSQPQPTVRPRLPIKQTKLMINSISQQIQQLQQLPYLLWQRYCLDHQLARWRLWGVNKFSRDKKNINYELSLNIMNQKQLQEAHSKLDSDFIPIIGYYIKTQQIQKALNLAKNHIRLIKSGKNLVEFFDDANHRAESIELQYYYDQKQRQLQYEAMQQMAMKQLKQKLQITVKSKKQNPMNPKYQKQTKQSIAFNISSQPSQSQNSSIMEDITHRSQQNSKADEIIENPFLKKKSTTDKKQQIQDHIEKFAVKRKVEEKKKK